MLIEPFPDGLSTGLHYHVNADEFFYVVKGRGTAHVAGRDHLIEVGDVVFIPAGMDHRLFAKGSTMELVAFLDKPGLDEEFGAWHRAYRGMRHPLRSDSSTKSLGSLGRSIRRWNKANTAGSPIRP